MYTKNPGMPGFSFTCTNTLFDDDFGAAHGVAGKTAYAARLEGDDAVLGSMDGVISAELRAFAGALRHADLADNNLAGLDLLACIQLHAKALAWTIVDVFGGTASFYV